MKLSKRGAWTLLIIGVLIAGARIGYRVIADYQFDAQAGSYWNLSERASTIVQKSEYMDKFVTALEGMGLEGTNSSLFLETSQKSFDENMKALKSLQGRLRDISGMDENSFAYQTALQQITAQEQGEAGHMLEHICGCWLRENHYTLWNWIWVTVFVILEGVPICWGAGWLLFSDDY